MQYGRRSRSVNDSPLRRRRVGKRLLRGASEQGPATQLVQPECEAGQRAEVNAGPGAGGGGARQESDNGAKGRDGKLQEDNGRH